MKFVLNKKYRLKQDLAERKYGKIPQDMTVTFVNHNAGLTIFKLPNGKQIEIPEKTALATMEALR